MRKSIILAGLLALFPTFGQAKTLEDLLVEKGVVTKAEAQATNSGATRVFWNKGTRLEFPDNGFSAQINTLVQTRYSFIDRDSDAGEQNSSSFDIRRARLIVSGKALHEEFSYYLNTDFVADRDEDGKKTPELLDAYLTWHACDWADIRMGQFKTPLSRQFNSSSSKLQFPDRSVASEQFDLDRQAGLSGTARFADDTVWVSGGVFNGESDGEGRNFSGVDTEHTGTAAVRWAAWGKMDVTEEGDVGWTEEGALNLGAVYAHSAKDNTFGGTFQEADKNSISADVNWKQAGWSFHGEFFYSTTDPDVGEKIEPVGFYAQAGWFFDPKTTELAVRYAHVDCDDGAAEGLCSGNDNIQSASASLNYFWWAHHLKAQLAFEFLNEDTVAGDDFNTNRWIFQLSSWF